jgi:hypothetical protein
MGHELPVLAFRLTRKSIRRYELSAYLVNNIIMEYISNAC